MTFNTNVPNAGQSPGLFPAQNNTNFTRLKTIQGADHVFNDTAADTDGHHSQVTLINRVDPTGVVTGGNSVLYGKTATDAINELWFYDGTTPRQENWRQQSGLVNVSGSYATILPIPANAYGYIYLTKGLAAQAGTFVSNGSVVNGFSYVEKFEPTTGSDYILRLGMGIEASALNLRVRANVSSVNGVTTSGNWNYYAFWRLL